MNDIFRQWLGVDHCQDGGNDADNAANMEGTPNHTEQEYMKDYGLEEFNEPPQYKKDLISMQGPDDESNHVYAELNEDSDVKNPHLEISMKFLALTVSDKHSEHGQLQGGILIN